MKIFISCMKKGLQWHARQQKTRIYHESLQLINSHKAMFNDRLAITSSLIDTMDWRR
jgi:hypothetical protein